MPDKLIVFSLFKKLIQTVTDISTSTNPKFWTKIMIFQLSSYPSKKHVSATQAYSFFLIQKINLNGSRHFHFKNPTILTKFMSSLTITNDNWITFYKHLSAVDVKNKSMRKKIMETSNYPWDEIMCHLREDILAFLKHRESLIKSQKRCIKNTYMFDGAPELVH